MRERNKKQVNRKYQRGRDGETEKGRQRETEAETESQPYKLKEIVLVFV